MKKSCFQELIPAVGIPAHLTSTKVGPNRQDEYRIYTASWGCAKQKAVTHTISTNLLGPLLSKLLFMLNLRKCPVSYLGRCYVYFSCWIWGNVQSVFIIHIRICMSKFQIVSNVKVNLEINFCRAVKILCQPQGCQLQRWIHETWDFIVLKNVKGKNRNLLEFHGIWFFNFRIIIQIREMIILVNTVFTGILF